MFQLLISHGHNWKDIQNYTFNEIGVFVRIILELEKKNQRKPISDGLFIKYAQKEEIKAFYKEEKIKKLVKRPSKEKVKADWKRLALASKGQK